MIALARGRGSVAIGGIVGTVGRIGIRGTCVRVRVRVGGSGGD